MLFFVSMVLNLVDLRETYLYLLLQPLYEAQNEQDYGVQDLSWSALAQVVGLHLWFYSLHEHLVVDDVSFFCFLLVRICMVLTNL